MAYLSLSIEDLKSKIKDHTDNGAFMIYWNHRMEIFEKKYFWSLLRLFF
jgi:ABC-type uncharacterized transport system ATPase subunit